jgi:hypothetical protein
VSEDEELGEFDMVSVPCEVTGVNNDEFVIFDWAEFAEAFDCYGMTMRDNKIFLLDRETRDFKALDSYKIKKLKSV